MTADQIETLRLLVGLAEEAVSCRELDPDEDDTPEVIALHRETVTAGEALLASLRQDKVQGLETPRMLVLSTAHISYETSTLFDLSTDDVPPFFEKRAWGHSDEVLGWIIPLVEGEPFPHTCPGDLLGIHLLAIANGCTWIMLDRDADVIDALPSYDW